VTLSVAADSRSWIDICLLYSAYRLRSAAMETSLHRELKRLYAGTAGRMEVRLGKFRVDALIEDQRGPELIEIQHGPLSLIRDKIRRLTRRHRVRIVKPIVGRKQLIKRNRRGGRMIDQRWSPRLGRLWEVFDELVFFTRAFPHRNLSMDVLLVDIEEWRYPRRNIRGRWRRSFTVEDQKLLAIRQTVHVATAADLQQFISCPLPEPFHTAHLASALDIDRWVAQRMAYVLRKVGTVQTVGKQRGAWLYRWSEAIDAQRAA
jgi:hypothetical protein